MKTTIFFIIASVFAINVKAQEQLQNPGFEDWEEEGTPLEEPVNWSSLKTADALASSAPKVIQKISGRNGGSALQLEVKSVFGIAANAIITNGRVHADFNPENGYVFTDVNNPKWHSSFSSRPDSIVGWYKYFPISGDIGKIEILTHSGNEARLPRNSATIASEVSNVRFNFTEGKTEWTRFSKAFTQKSTDEPAYILTTITAGDSTQSVPGTILEIDDLQLIYNSMSTMQSDKNEIAVNGSNGYLYFDVETENISYSVIDITGKKIQSGKASHKVPFHYDSGIYFINIAQGNQVFTKKLYISN